jgi:hypothetical protein
MNAASSSPRVWAWAALVLCALLAALLFLADALARWNTVAQISAVTFSDVPPHSTALPPGAWEEHLVMPHSAVDGRWWVVHTREMLREGRWRVRWTDRDNAPEGREVHWSSLPVWILAALAGVRSWGTGQAAEHFVSAAALAFGPLTLGLGLAALAWLAARGFGRFAALYYLVVLLTSFGVVRCFVLGETDHHGIVLVFISASLLCLLCGGGGFARGRKPKKGGAEDLPTEEQARRWFAASGLLGAASLWVSAATAVPVLFGAGFGALLGAAVAAFAGWRDQLRPGLWLVWGAAGCAGSVFFYLLEYFPGRFGLRLEVNHPLYGLAWLAAANLLRVSVGWIKAGRAPRGAWSSLVFSTLLAAVPLVLVFARGRDVFWVSDKFLLDLHREYISEFQSLAGVLDIGGMHAATWLIIYPWVFVTLATALISFLPPHRPRTILRLLPVILPAVLVMQILAVLQVRWGSIAFALWALCVLVILADVLSRPAGDKYKTALLGTLLASALLALVFGLLPEVARAHKDETRCLQAPLKEEVGGNLLIRDVTHRLLQSTPGQLPTVLTGPNTSTEMVYHGGVRVLGTLYWENTPGLKRAAEIFAAGSEEETKRLLEEAGVTHIVVPSWSNFGAAYADLLAKASGKDKAGSPYLDGVLKSEDFPVWLRPFAYPIPTGTGVDAQSVRVIAFLPGQNEFEWRLHRGIYHFDSGRPEQARVEFEAAQQLRPGDARAGDYLRRLTPDAP